MDKFSLSHPIGMSYLEAHFHSSMHFSQVYRIKAMVPIEIMLPSARLEVASTKSLIYIIVFMTWRSSRREGITQRTIGFLPEANKQTL